MLQWLLSKYLELGWTERIFIAVLIITAIFMILHRIPAGSPPCDPYIDC